MNFDNLLCPSVRKYYSSSNMSEARQPQRFHRTAGPGAALFTLFVLGAGILVGRYVDLMPTSATLEAALIDRLFSIMLGIAFAIFILVEGVLLYAVLRFRRRKGHEGEGVPLHGSNRLELAWTVIPALIVFWLAAVSGQVIFRLDAPPEDALRVRVVARQFSWQFEYPEYGVSSSELNVPIDVPVELELISMDVIHSFWVPAFRLKQDALPMRETRLNFTATIVGEYPVVCAELCGAGHAVMRTRVFVQERETFASWLAEGGG